MKTKARRIELLQILAEKIRVCEKCPLHKSRMHAVPGDGSIKARVMFIGEAPGQLEDRTGSPFVGAAGQFLNKLLEETGLNRSDLFITNTVKCRPPRNRIPKAAEIETCTSNYLFKQIDLINPKLIVALGGVAAKTLLGVHTITKVHGRILIHEERNYFVTYHPAVRFYRQDLAVKIKEDFAVLKEELQKL